MKNIFSIIILILIVNSVIAQDFKFGKVSKEELEEKVYPLDSSANAVFLYKERSTNFKYVQGEGFRVVTDIHERIKIYNAQGFDWATKEIDLYKSSSSRKKENVVGLKAYTYVLENKKIVKFKLEKNQVFSEEKNKYWNEEKFTMPNIKDGCVVEWKYEITSPFRGIDDVQFQHSIPVKKMIASVEIPEYFVYKKKSKGYYPVSKTSDVKNRRITISNKERVHDNVTKTVLSTSNIDYNAFVDSYDMTNVPALIEESYVNNMDNYNAAIEYEYSELHWPGEPFEYFSKDWESVTKTVYDEAEYHSQLSRTSHFSEDLAQILNTTKTESDKIIAIYEFVKKKIKWNEYTGIWKFHGAKKAYKEGVGNVSDINLNLVAMLKEAGFNANPIVLSTRAHGIPLFPTLDGLNYVIAAVELDSEMVLLDATEEFSTPNNLPLRTLNWRGRLVKEKGVSTSIDLAATNSSAKITNLNIKIDEAGEIEGMCRASYTNLSALNKRNTYAKKTDDAIIETLEGNIVGIEIGDFRISNKSNAYKPYVEMFKFTAEDIVAKVGTKLYVKPLLFKGETENPFKLEKRDYPIDFGSSFVEKTIVGITIPKGYVVSSKPENMAIGLPNDYGVYGFQIEVKGNQIVVASKLEIKTAIYPVEFYDEIKEFYKLIVNKNLEQIVLDKGTYESF